MNTLSCPIIYTPLLFWIKTGLKKNDSHGSCGSCGSYGSYGSCGSHGSRVETHGRASLQPPEQRPEQKFTRKPKSISSFIGGFKSAVNSKIDDYIDENNLDIPKYNKNNHFFQSNYHDHIIRNDAEFQRIKNYIINNPLKWEDDRFNFNKKDSNDEQ